MNPKILNDGLKNYMALLKQVDLHIKQVETDYSDKIVCKKGCDSCCRFLNLFPVEAFALASAFLQTDKPNRDIIRAELKKRTTGCPLLINHQCHLYGARPIICRTHGYPLYFKKKGTALVDFCPKNFKGMTSFPKESLLDLEQLNTLLAAINKQFLESIKTKPFADRIPMSRALLLLAEREDV
ncbi:MAG: YkgJ family cysteine cluster protein [Deltaproteobacteria bacterium]|nr:MAG: YkgJ family cysteine cluster protein [Deltaproteobacteria bacterium]